MRSTIALLLCIIAGTLAADLTVYDGTTGTIPSDWHNFSWATVNLQSTTYVHTGDKYAISFVCTGWKGLYLTKLTTWDVSNYNLFTFWLNGGDEGGQDITVQLISTNNSKMLDVSEYIPNHVIPAKTWIQVTIPIDHFQAPSTQIKGFWFQANSKTASSAFFDDIKFELGTIPPVAGPNLTVDATASKVPINDEIYGATIFWDSSTQSQYAAWAKEVRLPINRIGGDATTRYNWQVDSSNAGADWFFMGGNGNSNPTPGGSMDNYITLNNQVGSKTVITIPMIQYINKESAWHCSFPKSVYGPQQSYNPYIHPNNDDCGNGKTTSGADIDDKNPLATDIPNTPEIQKSWISHIVGKFGNSAKSGVVYQLDNEVSNWAFMHRDVHPQKVTYEEIVNQTIIYGSAVKEADPTALLAAPSEIQFAWYPDWGGEKNIVFFLQALQQYEKSHGKRILDTYDCHYPDANDNHWPKLTDVDKLRTIVDQTYPGTGISFSEWTLSGTGPLNGALAIADQFGQFAKNKVVFASVWGVSTSDLDGPIGFAFRVFRNFDGKGNGFGDQYVSSSSSDDATVSVHSSIRSSDEALIIAVINKTPGIQESYLTLKGFNPKSSAQVYQYSAANVKAIVSKPNANVSSSGFQYNYDSFSITIIILEKA
eukprot:TRINITY_DN15597_c0_g1_i1.p1 TRINITY_DN15597_c0_g1~~TRINITY_DN15597_c0_g1_i1.p1  ORF type:complete len:652 (-),score=145.36 TRINITY_DN15597_c0_g1_i1:70-2025(-)